MACNILTKLLGGPDVGASDVVNKAYLVGLLSSVSGPKQFRDQVPGYAFRVQALTQPTHFKGPINMAIEVAKEFRTLE